MEMSDGALQRKLRIGPGMRLLVLNAPEGYRSRLGRLPDGASLKERAEGTFDWGPVFRLRRLRASSTCPHG